MRVSARFQYYSTSKLSGSHRCSVARIANFSFSFLFFASAWRCLIFNALPVPYQSRFSFWAPPSNTCAKFWNKGSPFWYHFLTPRYRIIPLVNFIDFVKFASHAAWEAQLGHFCLNLYGFSRSKNRVLAREGLTKSIIGFPCRARIDIFVASHARWEAELRFSSSHGRNIHHFVILNQYFDQILDWF